ncbi:MAG: hypothetical protein ACTHM1_07650 [Solirubrobacteraceae bacterium]
MRLATYNVDNLFERPLALALPGRASLDDVLEGYATITELIAKDDYGPWKNQIVASLQALGLERSDENAYARITAISSSDTAASWR